MAQSTQAQAAGGPVNVVLLGHSYVRRLREYAARSQCTANLGLSGIQVRYVCLGGMTLRQRLRGRSRGGRTPGIRDHLQAVTACCPSLIVLHIGENDLGYVPASEVAGEILQLASDLSRDYGCPVYVTQLIAWPSHSTETVLDVQQINTELLHTLPPHHFWRHHCGLSSRSRDVFLPDCVHLNDLGMSRYYASVRTLIGRAVRHRHQ